MLTDLIVGSLMVLILSFVLTQCIVPTLTGGHWFPLFRSQRRELLGQLEEARDEQEMQRMKEELHKIKGDKNAADFASASDRVPDSEASDSSTRPDSGHGSSRESN